MAWDCMTSTVVAGPCRKNADASACQMQLVSANKSRTNGAKEREELLVAGIFHDRVDYECYEWN
jgi:hypothetical protein